MSKTTIAIISILYVVSIFVVGVFGMTVKAYDKINYVDNITLKVEAENEKMFSMQETTRQETGADHEYTLIIHFYENYLVFEGQKYLPLSIIPQVTYMSGDLASTEEKIKFVPDKDMKNYQEMKNEHEKNLVEFDGRGQLVVNDPGTSEEMEFLSFKLKVQPENSSINGSSAILWIVVVNSPEEE